MPAYQKLRTRSGRRATWFLALGLAVSASATPPGSYDRGPDYRTLMVAGLAPVEKWLTNPSYKLSQLESAPADGGQGWRHFPHAILAAAVLPERRELAVRIGDLLANDEAAFTNRLDWHRDTYMWLEAYRRLSPSLDAKRRARWGGCLRRQLAKLAAETARDEHAARYTGLFLGTSPNHFALWASTVYLGGIVFGEAEWQALGRRVMRRFVREQHPDGFWGEQTVNGPTLGYNALTFTAVALYAEHAPDPEALSALRRATHLHVDFTHSDGQPNELLNDRNRHWFVSPWGHFGFSRFPEGRHYASQLTAQLAAISLETLGRLAQNHLYWHAGPAAAREVTSRRLTIPVQRRRAPPWTVTLSGLAGRAPAASQWFLDRQSHVSVAHSRLGLIVSGANAKRQPELATLGGAVALDGSMADEAVSLAYEGFGAMIEAGVAAEQVKLTFTLRPHGPKPPAAVPVVLQVALRAGEWLETAAGHRELLGEAKLEIADCGAWIRHRGVTIELPVGASLKWPVFGYSPYRNGPETALAYAIGRVAWLQPVPAQTLVRLTVPQ